MFFAIITEIIEDNRGVLAKLLTVFDFTIKYSHWIFVKSVPTGLAKLVFPCGKILFQSLAILCTAGWTAYRVDVELDVSESCSVKNAFCKRYYLCVCPWTFRADHFTAKLVELSEPAFLCVLVSET